MSSFFPIETIMVRKEAGLGHWKRGHFCQVRVRADMLHIIYRRQTRVRLGPDTDNAVGRPMTNQFEISISRIFFEYTCIS